MGRSRRPWALLVLYSSVHEAAGGPVMRAVRSDAGRVFAVIHLPHALLGDDPAIALGASGEIRASDTTLILVNSKPFLARPGALPALRAHPGRPLTLNGPDFAQA